MRKNPHGRILKMELKEQHLNTVLKSYSYFYNLLNFWNRNPCSKLISGFKHIVHNSQSKEEKKKNSIFMLNAPLRIFLLLYSPSLIRHLPFIKCRLFTLISFEMLKKSY